MASGSTRLSVRKRRTIVAGDGPCPETKIVEVKSITDDDVGRIIIGCSDLKRIEDKNIESTQKPVNKKGRSRKPVEGKTENEEGVTSYGSSGKDSKRIEDKNIESTPKSARKRGRPRKPVEGNTENEGAPFGSSGKGSNKKLTNIKKTPRQKKIIEEEIDEESDITDDDEYSNETLPFSEKPTGLYDEDDVAGNDIYSFPARKTKSAMRQKAEDSASKNTPRTPITTTPSSRQSSYLRHVTPAKGTPRSKTAQVKSNSEIVIPKTPYQLRARQKKALQAFKRAHEEDGDDSDYEGSEDSSSHSEKSDSSAGEEDVDDKEGSDSDSGKGSEPSCRRSLCFIQPPSTKKQGKDINYVFTADVFFESQSTKCKTSDNRISRLRTPRLDSQTLGKLLTDCDVSSAHQHALAVRRSDVDTMYRQWMFALREGFSVLAYGLGSKYPLLQRFHKIMLPESHVLVVNGFFPSLTVKEMLETLARDLLGLKQSLPSAHAIIDWIEERRSMPRVFLIVHNIDAEPLRSEKSQRILCRLASLPRVHLIASVDHINAPLLWDQAKLSSYNWLWQDITSYLPYQQETSYESSLLVQHAGTLALSSLLSVYRSLTQNSRGVFRIILDRHLEENNPKFIGIAFSELYGKCREEMVVTSDLALRTMLTEFLDHQMVKWRRDTEHLYIPTDLAVLRQFNVAIQQS